MNLSVNNNELTINGYTVLENMPSDGQFVAIVLIDGQVFSSTMKWIDDKLFEYEPSTDDFTLSVVKRNTPWLRICATYLIVK